MLIGKTLAKTMALELPENIDLDNQEFQSAWQLIQHTNRSIFLTGKAGTGKSTFLRYICKNTRKKYVILAPTGIAAVNVGGVTMHSFFKMPLKPLLPDDPDYLPKTIRKTLRFPKDKVKLIKNIDLIIIDEISMVRSDMIDYMDRVLRVYSGNMREPFGGKQLLLVGDIFQLEPVVTADMKDILRRYYKQYFFFNAYAFSNVRLVPIELKKIYRQTDKTFVSMLDRVRDNHITRQDLALINSRYNANYKNDGDGFAMTLATRRDTVDTINDAHMDALDSKEYVFDGVIDGTFPTQNLPTSQKLIIKKGAQVIFIRNDKDSRWINGTLGRVSFVNDDSLRVELENGNEYSVEPEIWENVQYAYDEEKKLVIENVLGSFRQYPLKPAWALTVHKSQGLTFNNVVIDFTGGAFSSGQTYVALSRCTSLEGIVLLKPIAERDIIVNPQVVDFSKRFNDRMLIDDAMKTAKAKELYKTSSKAFDSGDYRKAVSDFTEAAKIKSPLSDDLIQRFVTIKLSRMASLKDEIKQLETVIDSQRKMLYKLAMEYVSMGQDSMSMGNMAMDEGVHYGAQKTDSIAIKAALANYNKALSLWPECVPALIGKARVMVSVDECDEAVSLYDKAISLDEKCYDAHLGRGYALKAMENMPAAIKAFKRAVKLDKNAVEPHVQLQEIYEQIGLDDMADVQKSIIDKLRQRKRKKNNKKD